MQLLKSCSWSIKATLSVLETSTAFEQKPFDASALRFDGRTFRTPREWDDASPDLPSASSAKADAGFSFLTGLYGVIPGARVEDFYSELHAQGFLPSIKGTRALRVSDLPIFFFPTFLPDLISATESFFKESRASSGEFRAEEQSSAESEPESSELGLSSPSPEAESIRVEMSLPSSAQIYAVPPE